MNTEEQPHTPATPGEFDADHTVAGVTVTPTLAVDSSAADTPLRTQPDVVEWTRVAPSYAWADLVLNLVLVLVVAAVFAVIYVLNADQLPLAPRIIFPVVVLVLLVNALFAFRRVRAIGYILREDDLLFRRGIMFERIIAVPYGRLQLVDVTRGPVLRALGLATLKFVTASAATGVQLPGLKLADAEKLRDKLVELAEIRRSGL